MSRRNEKKKKWLAECRALCSFNSPAPKEDIYILGLDDGEKWGRDQAIEEVLKIMTEAWEPFDQVELKVFNKIKSLREEQHDPAKMVL